MQIRATLVAFSKILSLAAASCLVGCAVSPRDGQFYPGGPTAAVTFNGFISSPDTDLIISAINPTTRRLESVTTARSSRQATDCDVSGECWYQYSVDRVLPRRFWRDIGGGLLRATISTAALQGIDGTLVTFPAGAPTDQCISDNYSRFGGRQTALNCGGGFEASITTCKVAPCSQ